MPRRKTPPTVRIKTIPTRKSPHCVYYYRNRKEIYVGFFKTKGGGGGAEQAQAEAQEKLDREFYQRTDEGQYSARFRDHIDDFIAYQNKLRNAPDTIDFYRQKLGYLAKQLGHLPFSRVDREAVRAAIKAAGNGPTWENGILRALSAYLNWGYTRAIPLCPPSFTRHVNLENPRPKRHKNFYTVAETALMLYRGMDDWRRVPLALAFFSGIRPRELSRMPVELVDPRSRTIYMPEYLGDTRLSKTAGYMESLPPVLWEWLDGHMPARHICQGRSEDIIKNIKRYADFTEAKYATARRTFATYSCNLYGTEATRKNLRHEDDLQTMEKHYLGCTAMRKGRAYIASKRAAATYFSLTPSVVRAFGLLYDSEISRRKTRAASDTLPTPQTAPSSPSPRRATTAPPPRFISPYSQLHNS